MQIWVDADACPKAIKDILFRVAERTTITTTLVANQYLQTPPLRYIKLLQVKSGFDVADNEIVKRLSAGDLVITGDIPLAYEVICKGGHAINPRGERYAQDTIKERLSMRDFMDTLRGSGNRYRRAFCVKFTRYTSICKSIRQVLNPTWR
jgi:uncharacterized protein YaiI (UPF0178 family)